MLFHHLFYSENLRPLYDDITIHGMGIVNQLGIFCKICVAVFVFASGYGLAVSTPGGMSLKDFYCHRFRKLYLNYWFIWLLFVPIGVFVFGRTFIDAYGEHASLKGVLDVLGLLKMFGYDSYNPTWWFYNCIIILYLIFPLLNKYLWRNPYVVISMSFVFGGPLAFNGIKVATLYLVVFLSGMLFSKVPVDRVKEIKWWQLLIVLFLLPGWRMMRSCPRQFVEPLICMGISLFVYLVPMNNWVGDIFAELGKHSMNMFLVHTFIFYYWFKDFIYITRNPLLIFLSLTLTSYLCSIMIEWIKKKVGFYKLL